MIITPLLYIARIYFDGTELATFQLKMEVFAIITEVILIIFWLYLTRLLITAIWRWTALVFSVIPFYITLLGDMVAWSMVGQLTTWTIYMVASVCGTYCSVLIGRWVWISLVKPGIRSLSRWNKQLEPPVSRHRARLGALEPAGDGRFVSVAEASRLSHHTTTKLRCLVVESSGTTVASMARPRKFVLC